jgi:hypothetical protein
MGGLEIIGMELPQQLRPSSKKKKRKTRFKAQWVKLSRRWAEALRQSNRVSTYQLAIAILFEAFKREQTSGEIILSTEVTGMTRMTRKRATEELVKLKLIRVSRHGKQAARVVDIIY